MVSTEIETPAPVVKDINRKKLLSNIKALTKKAGGRWGVWVYELDTKKSFALNENDRFIAASTYKLGVLAQLLEDIEKGRIKKTAYIAKTASDYEAGTGILQGAPNGSKYQVIYLAKLMLHYSDNVASKMLGRTIGWQRIYSMTSKKFPGVDIKNNMTTAKAMGLLMTRIYQYGFAGKENTAQMLMFMRKTAFEDSLPRYLPKDVRVYHKTGTRAGAVADVGAIHLGNRVYIVSVYAYGIPEERAKNYIGKISKVIYDAEIQLN